MYLALFQSHAGAIYEYTLTNASEVLDPEIADQLIKMEQESARRALQGSHVAVSD